ncbi:MAG: response regulator transcription factor [Rudaea sp.]|uniref:response regulator n=1 Tax=Rudaea sp. TaxID=2136325 RepID=UPI0039E52118
MVSTASSTPPPSPHLLVVDDETEIADSIARYFGHYGFRVSTAADGAAMREIMRSEAVDAVLLDLGLPREDGFELTRWLREHWRGAILIVTGRGESVDRVVGLELGADDYVTKPFDLRELLARVRSVLRRTSATPAAPPARRAGFAFSGFLLDPDRRHLADADGAEVALTTGEFDLLCVLVRHPGRVLSRDAIMSEMHGRESGPFDRAIDVQIGRLRRKIEADPARPQLIKSVRNAGYLFAARVDRG